ncbi:hypothetical protein TWF696_006850 [Orbilia brochopaga]|uniref:Uncharacterized protein n=1 Tax=Orbilia brochopaga TaxID=3140254 RepID=A0AAV9URK4_9PEZI
MTRLTVEDLKSQVAGRPLGSSTRGALSGSLDNVLNNMSNLHSQDQIFDMAAPFFPTNTDVGIAALTVFVRGILDNWDGLKEKLIKNGVQAIVKGIDMAWQAVKSAATEFWNWLSLNWDSIFEALLTAASGLAGSVAGGLAGGQLGAEVGLMVGGPVGCVVGAGVGSLIGVFGGSAIGLGIGKTAGRALR